MLIVGGLFAIALLALIALIFTLRSWSRKSTRTKSPLPQRTQVQEDTTHESTIEQQEEEITEGSVPAIHNQSQLSTYNKQFREFAIELHILHRQVQEIDHRLGLLSKIIDHIEQPGNGRTYVEEDPHSTQRPSQAQ
jgi:FtsZ-interacting cell division protein ZipA